MANILNENHHGGLPFTQPTAVVGSGTSPTGNGGFAPRRRRIRGQGSGGQTQNKPNVIGVTFNPVPTNDSSEAASAAIVCVNSVLNENNNEEKPKIEDTISLEDAVSALNINSPPTVANQGNAVKTPVSVLQELLSRRGITPSYELVQIEGAIHEPTFRYRVSFNDKDIPLTAMGAGRSKKEAKHAAAKALIDKLTGVSDGGYVFNTELKSSGSGSNSSAAESKNEDGGMGNPIGWLQELCMSRRWPPPIYETEMEVGLPHERQFTIACTIAKYREVGQGKSKKIAKRLAAQKMWNRLQANPVENVPSGNTQTLEDEVEQYRFLMSRYGDVKDSVIQCISNTYSQKVAQFHKTLKNTTGAKLNQLQIVCLNDKSLNAVKFLEDIANEQQFEVTYVDIEEKSYSNRRQCLVQLSTLPVAVCHGSGVTSEEAQTRAALSALEYLKIMTKK